MKKKISRLTIWLLVMLMSFGCFLTNVYGASVVPTTTGENNPETIDGYPLLLGNINTSGIYTEGEVTVVVTFDESGKYVSWESNVPIPVVYVKGGDSANIYHYSPAQTSDTNLIAPVNKGGQQPNISHVNFYYAPEENPATPDLHIEKTASPTTVNPGDEITYSITVTNEGDGAATGVKVYETLPEYMDLPAGGSGEWTAVSEGSRDYYYVIGDLAAGAASPSITFNAVVKNDLVEVNTITNTAKVNCTEDATFVEASAPITVEYPQDPTAPNLSILKDVSPKTYKPGDTVHYYITVFNNGEGDATNVKILETLPIGMVLAPDNPSGWVPLSGAEGNRDYVYTVNSLAAGSNMAADFIVLVSNEISGVDSITNTAKANCTEGENWVEGSVAINIEYPVVEDNPVLAITKTADKSSVRVGDILTYTITVTNTGGAATGVDVIETAPNYTLFNDDYSGRWTLNVDGYHWSIGNLAKGQTVSATFQLKIIGDPEVKPDQITNIAKVNCTEVPEYQRASITVPVQYDPVVVLNGQVRVIKTIGSTEIPQKDVEFKLHVNSEDVRSVVTDESGIALFKDVPAGTYTLEEVKPAGFDIAMEVESPVLNIAADVVAADSIQVKVATGETTIVNVTNTPLVNEGITYDPGFKIVGYKFNDLDKDGRRDEGEAGLPNWTIQLWPDNTPRIMASNPLNIAEAAPIATTTTDTNGYYEFTGLGGGYYIVKEVQQSGWKPSTSAETSVHLNGGYYYGEIRAINLLDDVNFKKAMPNENTVFEAEGRIGLPGERDYELALKTINPTTEIKAQKYVDGWKNFAETQPFTLSLRHTGGYGNHTITITFTALGETIQTVLPNDYPNDIMIRTKAAEAGSGIILNNLKLNDSSINGTSVAVNGVRDTDILWLPQLYFGVQSNFDLTGDIMMYWDGNAVPERSELAFQIAVGDAVLSQTEHVDFGNYQQATPPPPPPPDNHHDDDSNPGIPDLVVSKTDNGSVVSPGGLVEYVITVENKGTAYAQGVKIYENLPEGATFVADRNPGWTLVDGKYVYDLGTLNVGQKREAKFILRVNDPFPAGMEKILNNVEVKDNGTETATADNKASDDTPVLIATTAITEPPVPPTPPTPPTPPVIEPGETPVPDLPFTGGMAEVELLFAGMGAVLIGTGLVLKKKK